ncbi:hypothetical protein FPV67DRAFT_903325 [Lyophyllum atratum]|nr:hypothetical protein FPV67DRAFT_903325 [Lyophyllum atratum]
MHVTRPPGLPALAIVMPRPQLPRSRSSVASNSPCTPRTPSCSSNTLFTTTTNTNRNSTDSWNSSNAADDFEWDWKPDQVRLLSRTLDALPAHLVTPFNGPIPPSNLLDKIARGVSNAKGPVDWPHSIRATRVKLIELSRARAKEEQSLVAEVYSDMEMDESGDRPLYKCYPESAGKGIGIKRPLYRQSSMDFMNAADLRDTENVACLSDRLQRTKTNYHPYSRHVSRSHLSSPAGSGDLPSLMSPSTPSSSTLNTLSSFSSAHRILRRTSSNLSSTSASSMSMMSSNGGAALSDPRLQRIRRAESFCAPAPPPKDIKLSPLKYKENSKDSPVTAGVKRAPSFGALAQESRRDRHVFGGALNTSPQADRKDASIYPSSDEEEKLRTKGAKKMRVKNLEGLAPAATVSTGTPPNSPPSTLAGSPQRIKTKAQGTTPTWLDCKPPMNPKVLTAKPKKRSGVTKDLPEVKQTVETAKEQRKTRSTPMSLQRNPSIFGAELPHLRGASSSPTPVVEPARSRVRSSPAAHLGRSAYPVPEPVRVVSPVASPTSALGSPQKVKTLRRVQRLALGRRISFGSLVAPGEDADGEAEDEDEDARGLRRERQRQRELGQLGSAFQLH